MTIHGGSWEIFLVCFLRGFWLFYHLFIFRKILNKFLEVEHWISNTFPSQIYFFSLLFYIMCFVLDEVVEHLI